MSPASTKRVSFKREPLAVGHHGREVFLLSRVTHHDGTEELTLVIGTGDTTFSGKEEKVYLKLADGTEENIRACHHFKFFCNEGEVTLTYMRNTKKVGDGPASTLVYAGTEDRKTWAAIGTVKEVKSPGILIPEIEEGSGDVVYFEHADLMKAAISKNLKTWKVMSPGRVPHWHFFEGQPFHIMGAMSISEGIAVFYESTVVVDILKDVGLRDQKVGEERFVKIGAALFSKENTTKLIWQTELPLGELPWSELIFNNAGQPDTAETEKSFTFLGVVPFPLGGDSHKKTITHRAKAGAEISKAPVALATETAGEELTARFYVASHGKGRETTIGFFEFPTEILHDHRKRIPASLRKSPKNPILEPTSHSWESGGAFNPAAVKVGNKIHLLYRAVGNDSWSRIGYASSKDGVHFDERLPHPVYSPHEWFESPVDGVYPSIAPEIPIIRSEHDHTLFASGGSWGGCEDPKATLIDGRIYMTYVAHNGSWPQRSAITSIAVDDFLKKKWKWSKSMLMSPPGIGSKSPVILPEKVNGKFVVFHRMWPNIMIDMVPDLEFGEGKQWLTGQYAIRPRTSHWDSKKISMGAPPIRTDKGWLAVYGAIDKRDSSRYIMGAMLLDGNDPRKVIARSRRPLALPDEWYENVGKAGVLYPGGAVDINGTLHVYYGGGDLVSCVATISTDELLSHLMKDRDPQFKILTLDPSVMPREKELVLANGRRDR